MDSTRSLTLFTGVALLGLGGALIARAVGADGQAGRTETNPDAAVPYGTGVRIEKAFTIDRPADEIYARWRALDRLPEILSHLDAVEIIDERRSRWTAHPPKFGPISWEAELIDDVPGERIAWRSTGSAQVPNAGSVRFLPAPGGRGTEVHVEIEYTPPAGPIGRAFATLFAGGDPGLMVETDLRRFKSQVEAGTPALNGTDVKA